MYTNKKEADVKEKRREKREKKVEKKSLKIFKYFRLETRYIYEKKKR
jgi:hypothetical protein